LKHERKTKRILGGYFKIKYLYIKAKTMDNIRKYIKTTIREYLNEIQNNDVVNYEIIYKFPENIIVRALHNGNNIGQLSIIDESDYLSPEDEPTFTILIANVDEEYRKQGIYINMIKYFLKNNKYGVKSLYSSKEPDFDTEPRSIDADNFWKKIYSNQKKYGVKVEKTDNDYEISLK